MAGAPVKRNCNDAWQYEERFGLIMNAFFIQMQGAVSQGVLWGIMVLGVYITYKILDIADLTVDGSFALGGCICALLVVEKGYNPLLASLIALLAGALAGLVTGALHTLFDIPAILAGILTQLGLWSINLRVMGKSNTPFLRVDTLITQFEGLTGISSGWSALCVGLVTAVGIILLLYWFFGTELGCSMRATGNNENMIRALGVNTKVTKIIALALSNGLVGLSGALVAQQQKYADIGMGTGAIVIGLAAIVIGDVLMGRAVSFWAKLISAVLGSIVYFVIRALVLRVGLDPNDMKLFSAIFVALALCIPVAVSKWRLKKAYSEDGGNHHAKNQ